VVLLCFFKKTTRVAEKKQKTKETLSQATRDRDGSSKNNRTRARDGNNSNKDEDKEALVFIKTKALCYNSSCNGLAEKKNIRILLKKRNKT
jgi:hypothetical protein